MVTENQTNLNKIIGLTQSRKTIQCAMNDLSSLRHAISDAMLDLKNIEELDEETRRKYKDVDLMLYEISKILDEQDNAVQKKKFGIEMGLFTVLGRRLNNDS